MSRESIKASIEVAKGDIARKRSDIAKLRSRKSETNASYAAKIKNASTPSAKAHYRTDKASAIAYIESQIRSAQSMLEQHQRRLAQLRAQLKTTK